MYYIIVSDYHRMSTTFRVDRISREKRSHHPTTIFSPSISSKPTVTHYLIYIADTISYLIVGKSSVKTVEDKVATLVLNRKIFIGEIIITGKVLICITQFKIFAIVPGNYRDCQKELNKRQRLSQSNDGKIQ